MESFFEVSNLPQDLVDYINKNYKKNPVGCVSTGEVKFPSNYREKLQRLLPEIRKYYEPKGYKVDLHYEYAILEFRKLSRSQY
jgi:hypothetical protein